MKKEYIRIGKDMTIAHLLKKLKRKGVSPENAKIAWENWDKFLSRRTSFEIEIKTNGKTNTKRKNKKRLQ